MSEPLVSIVIPIIRNDPTIQECIDAIKESYYRNYEIIVVDEGLERSAQRNIGIGRAKGEYLLILDSDMLITPFVIPDCVFLMETNKDCVGVYIPERIVTKGWFGRLRDWERQFYDGTLVDVARFVKTKDCPKFDETLHGVEDSQWQRQIEKDNPNSIFATTNFPFHHHDKVGLIKYLRKKWYYAACLSRYKKKNPDDRLVTFKYRCWEVFVENSKWRRLISRPDLAILVFCLLFVRGVIAIIQERRNPD